MQCEHIFTLGTDGMEHCHCGFFRTPHPHLDASLYVSRTPSQQDRSFNKYNRQADESLRRAAKKQESDGIERALSAALDRLPIIEQLLTSKHTSKGVELSKDELVSLEHKRKQYARTIQRYT